METNSTQNRRTVLDEIDEKAQKLYDEANQLVVIRRLLEPIAEALAGTDTYTSLFNTGPVFVVHTREALQLLMSLAPQWKKEYSTDSIRYDARIEEIDFMLVACDSALPSTCKLVEKEVHIPASPARTEKRFVLSCGPSSSATPATETQPNTSTSEPSF